MESLRRRSFIVACFNSSSPFVFRFGRCEKYRRCHCCQRNLGTRKRLRHSSLLQVCVRYNNTYRVLDGQESSETATAAVIDRSSLTFQTLPASFPSQVHGSTRQSILLIKQATCLIIHSSEDIPEVESIVVMSSKGYGDGKNINGYSRLWGKVRSIWQFIAERHLGDFDWFLKADDDTFIVVENLRRFIERRDPGIPVWYGAKLTNPKVKDGYQSGGAGYLLSTYVTHFI